MPSYEYKVLPAPRKGEKAKGIRTPEGRFANALESLMNRMGEAGWEFLRAEMLPNEERAGLTGSNTEWRNVLVFRRERSDSVDAFEPRLLTGPGDADLPEPDQPERKSALSAVAGLTGSLLGRGKQPETDPAPDTAADQIIADAETAAEDGTLTADADPGTETSDDPDAPAANETDDDEKPEPKP